MTFIKKWLLLRVARKASLSIFKSFIRPHLEYGDILYETKKSKCSKKLEKVQYKACLATFGAIQATRRQKNLRFKFKSSINC